MTFDMNLLNDTEATAELWKRANEREAHREKLVEQAHKAARAMAIAREFKKSKSIIASDMSEMYALDALGYHRGLPTRYGLPLY